MHWMVIMYKNLKEHSDAVPIVGSKKLSLKFQRMEKRGQSGHKMTSLANENASIIS